LVAALKISVFWVFLGIFRQKSRIFDQKTPFFDKMADCKSASFLPLGDHFRPSTVPDRPNRVRRGKPPTDPDETISSPMPNFHPQGK
jgi:hypothetical protein